jgi:carboxyl-terminal processing protease
MNALRILLVPLAASIALTIPGQGASEPDFKKIAPKITKNVGELLERAHYSRRKLDDSVSKQLLKNYLERWDYNHLFFTQKDVDGFNAKYATTLDDDIMAGNVDPALQIFAVYKKRVENRVAMVKELLAGKFEFNSARTVEMNRQKSPWPKDDAEADQLWRDRIEGEMLDRSLMQDKTETPVKVLTRRYEQLQRNIREQGDEDVIASFLSVLSETYDPHSEYMSRSQLDSFNINMSLQLVGIGAVLTSEEGYAKIRELVPGGPADMDGRLKVGDRVTAVAQGDSQFVETVDMKLDKVVEMIRGKEDTTVRLKVIPVSATDPADRKVIEIVRKKVKLKEQEAKAEIVERTLPDGSKQRLGWIILPSFYADMQHSGAEGAKSTTKDVLVLLERLKKENIHGLVMDLRRNGGGSLEEAVNLTGLFIKKGPVVIARDSNGHENALRDKDANVAYDGPMIVLTNKLSASASEIFAAALQDYNRAVVVGDSSTFGKGTVQTMVELGNIMALSLSGRDGSNEAGALKLTIQKFYRVSGGSTQLQGVMSDIKLPSLWDNTEIGESALKGPMPFDTIGAATYEKQERPLFKQELKQRSSTRVAGDQEFQWIQDDVDRGKKRIAENKVSLNEKTRRAELDEDKARKEKRNADRAKLKASEDAVFSVTLDNASKPGLEPKKDKKDEKAAKKEVTPTTPDKPAPELAPKARDDEDEDEEANTPKVDPIRNETLNILGDLVEFARKGVPATASTQPAATPRQQ